MSAIQTDSDITASLYTALRSRYPGPEWLTQTEIRCGGRLLDVVACRMWTEARILGFELKASRGDWLREMRTPEKADSCVGLVDEFWLVTAPGVAKLEEIPEHWGWICQQPNGKLRQAKKAPELTVSRGRKEREFWASMVARAWRSKEDRAEREKAIADARRQGWDEAAKQAERNQARAGALDQDRLNEVARIQAALGHPQRGPASVWDIEKHAETIKAVIAGEKALTDLKNLHLQAQRITDRLEVAAGDRGLRTVVDAATGGFKEVSV